MRKRDVARLVLQQAGALPEETRYIGGSPEIKPEPLTRPQRPSRALSAETRDIIGLEQREAATRTLQVQDSPLQDTPADA